MSLPWTSARLAAWTAAFLDGAVSPDDAVDGAALGAVHRVSGLDHVLAPGAEPMSGSRDAADSPVGLALALASLRRAGAQGVWMLWPRPGDLHGLPGPASTNAVVLEAGQGVVVEGAAGASSCVLVPSRLGDTGVLWTALPAASVTASRTAMADADRDLKVAVREATEALAALDVARSPGPAAESALDAARASVPQLVPPPGWPNRARVLLDTAQRLTAVAEVARRDDGAALTAREARDRSEVLRELDRAARRAFVAATNALSEERLRAR